MSKTGQFFDVTAGSLAKMLTSQPIDNNDNNRLIVEKIENMGRLFGQSHQKLSHKIYKLQERLKIAENSLESLSQYSLDKLLDKIYEERLERPYGMRLEDIEEDGKSIGLALHRLEFASNYYYLADVFNKSRLIFLDDEDFNSADIYFFFDSISLEAKAQLLCSAKDKALYFVHDGGLLLNKRKNQKSGELLGAWSSFTLDDISFWDDEKRTSRLSLLLDSKNLEVTDYDIRRSRAFIDFIVNNKISSFSDSSKEPKEYGHQDREKILVVDDSFLDPRNDNTSIDNSGFNEMLLSALLENPGADILIKSSLSSCGDQGLEKYEFFKEKKNIHIIFEACNSYELLEKVSKVYVQSSLLGFEALMAGKELHVFGTPFYAGWGLTSDRKNDLGRTRERSLEELVYIFYFMYTNFYNPETKKLCPPEGAAEHLLKRRKK